MNENEKPTPKNPADKIAEKVSAKKAAKVASDADMIRALKSDDTQVRKEALTAMFPFQSAVLIVTDKKNTAVTATDKMDAPSVFQALLFVAQQVGKFLGLQLNWMPDPEVAKASEDKIIVAPEGSIIT
jgi:hypothetical protein